MMRERRLLFFLAVGTCTAAAFVAVACGDDVISATVPGDSGVLPGQDAARPKNPITPDDDDDTNDDDDDDIAPPPKDAGQDATTVKDAGTDAKAIKDANGPGAVDADCAFNHECQLALRCECAGECACKTGPRGKNKLGQSCDGGNQCADALCVEGTGTAGYFCSEECSTPADCPATLPRCQAVSFVGKVCVRQP